LNRKSRRAAAALVALVLPGCASLDPAGDLEQASSLVAARSATETGWTVPWNEPAPQWDGRAPLSSDVAVRVALQSNRAIRAEVESIVAARADLVQAHLLPNPVINFAIGLPTDGMGGDPLAAAVVQQLAWIWRRPAAIDAAEGELRSRILAVSDGALRLVADVRGAHAEVWFAEQAVELQEQNVELLARSVRLLEDRFAVGEASRLDVNRAALDRRAAEVQLSDRRMDLDRTRRTLLELIGRAGADDEWRTTVDVGRASEVLARLDEDQVVHLAASQRLDVAAARAAVAARVAGVDLQELGRIPDVSAGVEYQQNFSNRRGVFPSVGVSPKLFDDNSARVARAESELRRAEIEADGVLQAAVAEARRAWIELAAQRDVVRAYEDEILALAESNERLARNAFEAGEAELTVLLEAQRQLNDARIELADRRRAATELLIELERAAGGTLSTAPSAATVVVSTGSAAVAPRRAGQEGAP
jgi:cobalt-zinc-cadmium efflux system outer membrane protein